MNRAPNKPFRRIPWTVTAQDLKAARMQLGVKLDYISDRLGPCPAVLRAIEEDHLSGTPDLLEKWAEILLEAPPSTFWRRVENFLPELIVAWVFIAGVTALVIAFTR